MNRRTFLKVLLGTAAVLVINPVKVLSENAPIAPVVDKIPAVKMPVENPVVSVVSMTRIEPRLIDIVKTHYPDMIAHQICSVQPMTAPTGQIFAQYVPMYRVRVHRLPWYKRVFRNI
jgi:hypothetical protein